MKNAKFKLSRDAEADIRALIKTLPEIAAVDKNGNLIITRKPERRRGSTLKQSDLKDGVPLVENAYYTVMVSTTKTVDHWACCKELYQAAGMEAVKDYAAGVMLQRDRIISNIRQENSILRRLLQKVYAKRQKAFQIFKKCAIYFFEYSLSQHQGGRKWMGGKWYLIESPLSMPPFWSKDNTLISNQWRILDQEDWPLQ